VTVVADRFELGEPLGSGGAGDVYKAIDRRSGEIVAIKIANDELPLEESAFRFEREAAALSVLESPHVVRIVAAGRQPDGRAYLVMELLAGRDLSAELREDGPLAFVDLVRWYQHAARALDLAHGVGIVHRDLKPSNLFLAEKDGTRTVKILDFGLVKDLEFKPDDAWVGTPLYMAPEQVRGHATRVGPATDIWALGMVSIMLLTGESYWRTATIDETLAEIDGAPLYAPSTRWSFLPRAFDAWFLRSCQRVAERRFPTVVEQVNALGAALGVGRRTDGPLVPTMPSTTTVSPLMPPPAMMTASRGAPNGLVGRQVEHRALEAQLGLPGRLITITGPPGAGKSRLARAVSDTLGEELPGGAWFVPLGALREASAIPDAIAGAIGLKVDGTSSVMAQVADALADRQPLIVLDCMENLLDGRDTIQELRRACPTVSWLITSRVPLALDGEERFALEHLDVPPRGQPVTLEEAQGYSAIQLFCERAKEARPGFELDTSNVADVVEICRRLGGLPLAIELAAARVRWLTPAEIAGRLGSAPIADAVEWSYGLLEPPVAALLRYLAALPGGVTPEGARAVAAPLLEEDVDLDAGIDRLVSASLVERTVSDPPRLIMLDSVRQWCRGRSEAIGEARELWQRAIEYLDKLVARADEGMSGEGIETWLALLEDEQDNLRAALTAAIREDPEMALRLTGRLARFWYLRGHYEEGGVWIEVALAAAGDGRTPVRRRALQAAGHLAFLRCDYDLAEERLDEAKSVADALGDGAGVAAADQLLGSLARERADYTLARRRHEQSLAYWRSIGDRREAARSQSYLAFLSWISSTPEPAADAWLADAEAALAASADVEGEIWARLSRGAIAHYRGDDAGARVALSKAFAGSVAARFQEGVAWSLNLMALGSLRRREPTQARSQLRASLRVHRRIGDLWRCASVLETLAVMAAAEDVERAAILFGGADRLRVRIGAPVPRCERALVEEGRKKVAAELGAGAEGRFAWGRALTLDDVVALAVEGWGTALPMLADGTIDE
jgi:non-specific serine/threonine protein kinase